jgi:hypothetical protein
MSFLTSTAELDRFIYGSSDLEHARRVMREASEKYAPGWIESPKGVLGEFWARDDQNALLTVIDVARVLYDLSASLTARSVPVFGRKVWQLFHAAKRNEYEELLSELRMGALWGLRGGPVSFEPAVPTDLLESPSKPGSPDFAIRLPSGDVVIEATTLRVDAFERWARATEDITRRLSAAIREAELGMEVRISAPLGVRADRFDRRGVSRLVQAMTNDGAGQLIMSLGPADVTFRWRKVPVILVAPGSNPEEAIKTFSGMGDARAAIVMTEGSSISGVAAVEVGMVLDRDVDEVILKSLRNTLNGKRLQVTPGIPALLTVQIVDARIPPQYVSELIDKRVWPNRKYRWLVGVGVHIATTTFERGIDRPNLVVTFNPGSSLPCPDSLRAIVESGAWFSDGKPLSRSS